MDDLTGIQEVTQSPSELVAQKIEQVLAARGITIPRMPDSTSSEPRPWLLRGEYSTKNLSNTKLEPQSGEMGSWGVFFADCLSALYKHKENGIYYVVPTSKLTEPWLRTPSLEFEKLYKETAQKYKLNPNTINGGVETEQKLYRSHNIYQAKRGIVTSHTPVPLDLVQTILIDTNGKHLFDKNTLPPEIREKIVEF